MGDGAARLSDLYGKPIVINFWATWCPPCIDELPVFARLQNEYSDRVVLLTVSSEAPGVARRYLHEKGYSLPTIEDPDNAVALKYSVKPLPVTLVLAPNGALMHVSIGELDWAELHGAIEKTLATP